MDITLEPLVRTMLDLTIDKFINGLREPQLRLRMLKYLAVQTRSLKGAFHTAEVEI